MPSLEIKNLKQLDKFAGVCIEELTSSLPLKFVVLLKGDMAVGKTQLVQFIAHRLGVEPGVVNSPTFSLINSYKTKDQKEIFHVDLYRLKSDRELEQLAFWDLFESYGLIFIEWPELILNKIPPLWKKLLIELKFTKNKNTRLINWQSLP